MRTLRTNALVSALAATLLGAPLAAQDVFTRITDLVPGTGSGVPELDAVVWKGQLYFRTRAGDFNFDLRHYDGSTPPTVVPGGSGINPSELTVWENELYFTAGAYFVSGLAPQAADRELWRFTGAGSPAEVLDLAASSEPRELFAFADRLCFSAATAVGRELVCWDGLTTPVPFDLRPGPAGSDPKELADHDGKLYFSAVDTDHGTEPYSWGGTGSPARLADLAPGTQESLPFDFTTLGDELYFGAYPDFHGRLFHLGAGGLPEQTPGSLAIEGGIGTYQGKLLVAGGLDSDSTPRLHRFDGSERVALEPPVSFADNFLEFAGATYFVAGLSLGDSDIWRYCGSESVENVSALFASNQDGVNPGLIAFGDRILFSAFQQATTGGELWALRPMEALFCSGFIDGDLAEWSTNAP